MSLVERTVRLNLLPIWRRRVRLWDSEFVAPSLDRLTALYLHRIRLMGRIEKQFFDKHLKPGMTVVDIGANQGLYTILFSRLVGPGGKVVSFEPEADMYEALAGNVSRNRVTNVEHHKVALGSEPGTAMLSRSLVHGGDNRLAPGHSEHTSQKESVPVNTLDDVMGEQPVDFIKMDVQGWEGEVFQGMKRVLRSNLAVLIHFEFWPRGLRMAGCEPLKLLQDLSKQGFQLFRVGKQENHPIGDLSLFIERLAGNRFTNLFAKRTGIKL